MLERIFNFVGGLTCHQLESRTLIVGGRELAVCSRCTGIFLGIFIAAMFLIVYRRTKGNKLFSIGLMLVFGAFASAMVADGATSYLGFRETTNFIRLISGTLFGISIPFLFTLALNYDINIYNENLIVGFGEFLLLTIFSILVVCLVFWGFIDNWLVLSLAICFSSISLYACFGWFLYKRIGEVLRSN